MELSYTRKTWALQASSSGLCKQRVRRLVATPESRYQANCLETNVLLSWHKAFGGPPNPIKVPKNAWNQYFPDETAVLEDRLFESRREITVADLQELVEVTENHYSGNRLLFVAVMMWGRGSKNGRLMPKFQLAMKSEPFDETLCTTRRLIMVGQPGDAYSEWIRSGVLGIREPFFTKWFFVCGLSQGRGGLQPFPLDSRVRSSLKALGWPSSEDRRRFRGRPDHFYEAYLQRVQDWSMDLTRRGNELRPLDVEQVLFRANGKST